MEEEIMVSKTYFQEILFIKTYKTQKRDIFFLLREKGIYLRFLKFYLARQHLFRYIDYVIIVHNFVSDVFTSWFKILC